MSQNRRSTGPNENALEVVQRAAAGRQYDVDKIMLDVISAGDLSKLTPRQKTDHYMALCQSLELNPASRPFELMRDREGKEFWYARKDAADQLRTRRGVSVIGIEKEIEDGIFMVTVTVQDRSGRTDTDLGAVPIANLHGEAKANAMMKAITKAKRRATLSICGLGMLDETEVEAIPGAQRVSFTPLDESVEPTDSEEPRSAAESSRTGSPQDLALRRLHAIGHEIGMDHDAIQQFAAAKSGRRIEELRSLSGWPAHSLNNLADLLQRDGPEWFSMQSTGTTAIETIDGDVDEGTGESTGSSNQTDDDIESERDSPVPTALPLEAVSPRERRRDPDRWTR